MIKITEVKANGEVTLKMDLAELFMLRDGIDRVVDIVEDEDLISFDDVMDKIQSQIEDENDDELSLEEIHEKAEDEYSELTGSISMLSSISTDINTELYEYNEEIIKAFQSLRELNKE